MKTSVLPDAHTTRPASTTFRNQRHDPASRIPIEPGDRVLDLCAAPGGKATAAGAALQGQGLLVANDISTSRARALLRNLELFGIPNVFVANETPAKLTKAFPEFFDKIILDAPCSGEGMFRKEEALAKDWTPEKSLELSEIQKELILQAADMLRPGGLMLYSTCTFAPAEDEQTVSHLLETVLTWNWQKWKIMKASPMEFLNGETKIRGADQMHPDFPTQNERRGTLPCALP